MKLWFKICTAVMIAALAAIMFSGCIYINGGNGLIGNGQIVTEERELKDALKGVINRTSFHVVIDPGLQGKAVIEGESNLAERVELSQGSDGVLTVGVESGTNIIQLSKMTVSIPSIVGGGIIRSEGSGDITLSSGKLSGDEFKVYIEGSGNVRLSLDTKALEIAVNGSGDAEIDAVPDTLKVSIGGSGDTNVRGSAKQLSVSISGSGDFGGSDFTVEDAEVNISASGNAGVNVSGKLTGSITGSGDIIYGGSPVSVQVKDSGSGDVRSR